MAVAVEELLQVDPATLVIGKNVRIDTCPGAREFAASIKARGVIEVITAYRAEDGSLVVLRGQRRAVVAAQVGTPSGSVAVRVVPAPAEVDRITDQMVENLHRAEMNQREVCGAVEQLSLCGVTAAQIAKRTAMNRATVDAALTVVGNDASRARMDAEGLTLDQAAAFAEFEGDKQAIEKLSNALRWGRSLEHTAQQLRDAAAEVAAVAAEADRLRADGLPALDPADAPGDLRRLRLDSLVTLDGADVPEADWPKIPGAAVVVIQQWRYPREFAADPRDDGTEDEDEDVDPVLVLAPVWICTDPEAAQLRYRYDKTAGNSTSTSVSDAPTTDAEREASRAEGRRVIENNKAWRSAETVRREWLARFVTRKTAPKGAENIICEALVGAEYTITKAMQEGHRLLCSMLGTTQCDASSYGTRALRHRLVSQPGTTKAALMLSLACVLAAWEDSTGTHTWRSPSRWDARIMGALIEWGYTPSDVETLLTTRDGTGPAASQDQPSI